MLKKPLLVCLLCLSGFLFATSATAQEGATLVLKSGERLSGNLVDLNASGFIMRVNGQERRVGANDVAVLEFTGGTANADVLARLRSGQQVVVLRNGQAIEGRLHDVGGTHPLRITVNTSSGARDFNSNEVAQVFLATPPGAVAVGTAGAPVAGAGATTAARVDANQAWVDTGVNVNRGDRVAFSASGDIMVAPGASAGVGGTSAVTSAQYPIPSAMAGALIGRVGNSAPFLIGSNSQPILMPADGRLMLGINDDGFGDNTGSFSVTITPTAQARRGIFRR
jgi:hypothetical protein